MATTRKNSTLFPAPRVVYTSPEGRIEVIRYDRNDYGLIVDTLYNSSYSTAAAAEVAGLALLSDEAAQVAVDSADMDAELAEYCLDWDASVAVQAAELETFAADWNTASARQRREAIRAYALYDRPYICPNCHNPLSYCTCPPRITLTADPVSGEARIVIGTSSEALAYVQRPSAFVATSIVNTLLEGGV